MRRTFYRIVQASTATREDFLSYEALGKQLWNPTPRRIRQWRGISAFETETLARSKARDYRLGPFIARLAIPDEGLVIVEQTGASGHFTLYGDPEDFLRLVETVVPVDEE